MADGLQVCKIDQCLVSASGKREKILHEISFSVPEGGTAALLGASGCGKTTLLNIIAGFETACAGKILFRGKEILKPSYRQCMVFQSPTLFSWLTIEQNVQYGLKRKRVAKEERRAQARSMLRLVGLAGYESYYPCELSGGMQQRAALARALVLRPDILLMDEPFAALDIKLRGQMQKLLLSVWRELSQTILFVTHDIDEALLVSQQVILLGGRPCQVLKEITLPWSGAPEERRNSPEWDNIRNEITQTLLKTGKALD